jgi:hypothetical protein
MRPSFEINSKNNSIMTERKVPNVGDIVYQDGCEFVVCEVKTSIDPISGSRIVNVKYIPTFNERRQLEYIELLKKSIERLEELEKALDNIKI